MNYEKSSNYVPTSRLSENRTSNILIGPLSISSLNRLGSNYSITDLTLSHTRYQNNISISISIIYTKICTHPLSIPTLRTWIEESRDIFVFPFINLKIVHSVILCQFNRLNSILFFRTQYINQVEIRINKNLLITNLQYIKIIHK